MTDDAELLSRYAAEGDQEAFRELVGRHLGLVHRVALRQCGGDGHRAQDVAQVVFTAMARKAAALSRREVLAGWLFTATHYAAAQAVRAEVRRQRRERAAEEMKNAVDEAGPPENWEKVRPMIDGALQQLRSSDRDAILLRFFEGRAFAEIGARFAITEDAARRRVERALDKIRSGLERRGVTSTTAALAMMLAGEATAAVPAELVATVATTALTAAAASSAAPWLIFMSTIKLQAGAAVIIAAAGVTGFVWQHQTQVRLTSEISARQTLVAENDRLRAENLRLTANASRSVPSASVPSNKRSDTVLAPARGGISGDASHDAPLAPGMSAVASLGDQGRATPRAAWATQLWAARTGDVALEATALMVRPEDRAKLEALAATLPAELRSQYDTAEKLMAFVLGGSPHPVSGMEVLGETEVGPGRVTLQTAWQHADDEIVHHNDVELVQEGAGWKMLVPTGLVDRAVVFITRHPPGAAMAGKN